MHDLKHLLSAAREAPDVDTLQVLADHLEEGGDLPRAEFIRVQLDLSAVPEGDHRRAGLLRREKELRRLHQGRWLGPFFDLEGVEVSFCRGIFKVSMTGPGLLNASREVPPDAPEWEWVVGGITLDWLRQDAFPGFLGSPLLPRVTSIGVGDRETLIQLASASGLTALSHLSAEEVDLGDGEVVALAGAPFLNRLAELDLGMNECVGEVGIAALVAAIRPGKLKDLQLRWCLLRDHGVLPLAESPNLAGLGRLGLAHNAVCDAGAEAFLESPFLQAGGHLDLDENHISPRTVRLLSRRFGDRVSCRDQGGEGEE